MENNTPCERYFDFYSQYRIIRGNYPGKRMPFVHGPAFWRYPSGKKMTEGFYNRGIRAGVWIWYSEEGEIIKTADFGCKEYQKRPFRDDESYRSFSTVVCTPSNTLLLTEDHGCCEWFWMPDRSIEETIEWWRGLDSVEPYFLSPQLLPGLTIKACSETFDFWYAMQNSGHYYPVSLNEDYWSAIISPSGEHIHHKNYEYAVLVDNSLMRGLSWSGDDLDQT